MGFFSSLFGSRKSAGAPNPEDAGRMLRQMMLTMSPNEIGVISTPEFPRIYGVLMDWPIDNVTATIFAGSTGAASLYTTTAFNVIGGEPHETVRIAAIRFVRAADGLYDSATPTSKFPYPSSGRVRFYLLTFDGVRMIDTDFAAIENGASGFSDFFRLGQQVVTELRLITERTH